MHPPDRTDQRLTALEIKASFADDLLEHLNRQVARQQDQIDLLLRELSRRRREWPADAADAADDAAAPRGLRDELPPHY